METINTGNDWLIVFNVLHVTTNVSRCKWSAHRS